jgi:uncharacterized ion transporter superfamily protein YfcC
MITVTESGLGAYLVLSLGLVIWGL